jgi:hypothetical protein
MSYYDDASLVLIPSGVKTSKVYSQKPTNGSGDLTFSRASTATRTNASGAIASVASNVPRLDYSGGATCPRLLLEPQRTNLVFPSATATTQTRTVTATAHTLTFYGTGTVVLSGVATGTLTGTGANNRVALTFTPTAGSLVLTVSGTVTNWQLEAGAFSSTVIETTTAAVTRIVDIAEKFGIGSLIGSPAGTIFLQLQILSLGYSRSFISLQDTSFATNSIRIECTAANRFRIQIRNASTTILDQTVTTGSAFTTGNYKIAYAYDTNTNGVAFYVNGVSLFTTTVASIPTACVNLFLGSRLATIYDLNVSDSFDQAALFKTRLTNAQLAQLTTL